MILVTGGAGFIGSHLVKSLIKNGKSVRILDNLSSQIHGELPHNLDWLRNPSIDFIRGSITCKEDVRKALEGVDQVVHLASETGTGQSMYEIEKYNHVNVIGTSILLDVLTNEQSHSVKKLVLSSSRSIYGEGSYICSHCDNSQIVFPTSRTHEQLTRFEWEFRCQKCGNELTSIPTSETAEKKPGSIYAATKLAQEDLVRISCESLKISYSILRLQNVYGEGQSLNNPYTGILSIFSTKIRHGKELPLFEDGLESRDFVHVSDVVQSMLLSLESDKDGIYNVGSGLKTSVQEMAEKLSSSFNQQPKTVVTKQFRLGDIRHNYADISNASEQLGFKPAVTLDSGLERFAKWVYSQELPEDILDKANNELIARKLMG